MMKRPGMATLNECWPRSSSSRPWQGELNLPIDGLKSLRRTVRAMLAEK